MWQFPEEIQFKFFMKGYILCEKAKKTGLEQRKLQVTVYQVRINGSRKLKYTVKID